MASATIRVGFAERGITELEVRTELSQPDASPRVLEELRRSGIVPLSLHHVRTGLRRFFRASLAEFDGSPLSQERALALMGTLQRELTTAPMKSAA